MIPGQRTDPLPAFRFRVELDDPLASGGLIAAGFTACSGLQAETETVEYHEGGRNDTVLRFRGQTRFPHLVLRRGLASSPAFWGWYAAIVSGVVVRRNGTICLLDPFGAIALSWDIVGAYPVKWAGPDLRGETSALAFESVELVHAGFVVRPGP
jgi:phage tail-like protein